MIASRITWLLIYKAPTGQWRPEVVTRIPSDTAAGAFQGEIRVEDWQGHFIKAYRFKADSVVTYTQSSFYVRPEGLASIVAPTETAPTTPIGGTTCTETDWYGCATIGDGPTSCQYVYTSEDCLGTFSAADEYPSTGMPTPPDYSTVGGGTSATTAPTTTNIVPDATITDNPIVAYVYNHLMSPLLTNGLKSILASFDDNKASVTFLEVKFPKYFTGKQLACCYKCSNSPAGTIGKRSPETIDAHPSPPTARR